MAFYGNNEIDDESCDSYMSDDSRESGLDSKEAEVRSDVECFTCKLAFCLKERKKCFFDYLHIFM